MSMRTIVLKLHKPGRRKSEIIDDAMLKYSLAYQYLLDTAYLQIEEIQEKYQDARGNYKSKSIEKWVDRDISKRLNMFGVESFKDSLKMDFAMTLSSYLQLRKVKKQVSYPVAYLTEESLEKRYGELMDELNGGHIKPREFEREVEKLNEKASELKPIFFCRYATNRDYCLVYDKENDRYFAKLYIMNAKSPDREFVQANKKKELSYVHKESKLLTASTRKERFIIVPLSFGKWQEQYLKKAVDNPGMLKTARLLKKKGEYFLSVNVELGEKEKIKPETFMGISRGLANTINYTVVDTCGEILGRGAIQTEARPETGKNLNSGKVHKIANTMVDLALKYKAQVITQPFTDRGDRLQWIDEYGKRYIPVLNCSDYNFLNNILKYKLVGEGLPQPVETSPTGVFHTCPVCGLHSVQNRFSKDTFICMTCGQATDIESLGSLNLARRLIKYNKSRIEIKVIKNPVGVRFINEDLGLDYNTPDPMNCFEEFKGEVMGIVQDFYANMKQMARDKSFNKKYGMVQRIEAAKDITNVLKLVE